MFSFFRSKPKAEDVCKVHSQPAQQVCIRRNCIYPRFMCSLPQCKQSHLQHETSPYAEYTERLALFKQEVATKQTVDQIVKGYYSEAQKDVSRWAESQKAALFNDYQSRYFSKNLAGVEKKYLQGDDFIPGLFEMDQQNTKHLVEQTAGKVKEMQKVFSQHVNADMKNFAAQLMANPQKSSLNDKTSRLERLAELLPFTCKLNLKFQASMHGFVTKHLYSLKLRGPVVILVESKRRLFGGYSPNMFTEKDEYIEDTKAQGFLFSLDEMKRLPIKPEYRRFGVKGGTVWGFGRGDLTVSEQCQKACISWAEIGRVYQKPGNLTGDQKVWLAGAWYYRVVEYEVYEVEGIKNKS